MKVSRAIDHHYLIHAMKAGISLCVIASIAMYYHYQDFWWAIFLGFMCIQPNVGQSIKMMKGRFIGTWVGVGLALLITLTFNFNWIYYPLVIIAVGCVLYYAAKPNLSWAGLLCCLALINILVLGPYNQHSIAHFALERGLEISLAIIGSTIILIVLQFDCAHKTSLDLICSLLKQYQHLYLHIVDPYINQTKPSRYYTIQRQLKACTVHIKYLLLQMEFARHENKRKRFHPQHGTRLTYQMKRIQLILNTLRIMGEYYTVKDCDIAKHDREVLNQAKSYCATQFFRLQQLVAHPEKKQPQNYKQQSAKRLQALLRLNIKRLRHQADTKLLNRIIWLSIMQRLVTVLGESEAIITEFRAIKSTPPTRSLESEFGGLAAPKKTKALPLSKERLHYSLHAALSFCIILMLQQYFQWSDMIPVIAGTTIALATVSNYNPLLSNLGLGILGSISGTAAVWCALYLLNYFPQFGIVLGCLFLATTFASYFFTISQLQNKPYMLFAIFFILSFVIAISTSPATRGNLDTGLFIVIAILLGVGVISLISRTVMPFDYLKSYRDDLSASLQHSAHALTQLQRPNCQALHVQNEVLLMHQSLEKADRSLQQLNWQHKLVSRRASRGLHLLDFAESMASTVLMMQHFYFRSPTNSELAKTYLAKSKPIFTELTNNTTELIAEVHRHITTFDNQKYNRLKQQLYHIIQPLLSSPLWRSSGIVDIQTVALLHNGLQRLIDLQAQMDKALAEIIQEQTYVKAT
ncbi:MAG: FUSC family protein [Coxiellaceae bacterium]|nr:FUSC family protein [Coxiellaceae bacterium]